MFIYFEFHAISMCQSCGRARKTDRERERMSEGRRWGEKTHYMLNTPVRDREK